MKTDLVEIFQTIRAGMQPFATRGYTVNENSETAYDLSSEKNIKDENTTERFFCGVYIDNEAVKVKLNVKDFDAESQQLTNFENDQAGYSVTQLDDAQLKEILLLVEIIHTNFKENEWI
ncbi:hypothetical protein [Pedobacter mucosus]|uniref:hypothetical protein n=1 Tax=Pedobacter mucosus TaxID=2895286 RepID=UPI001EE4192F|nr:hypothetical protein [Pedobacter mucosus]UKT65307.1 hypothetical protein LOK61_05875 [Pedobacter mucosus]